MKYVISIILTFFIIQSQAQNNFGSFVYINKSTDINLSKYLSENNPYIIFVKDIDENLILNKSSAYKKISILNQHKKLGTIIAQEKYVDFSSLVVFEEKGSRNKIIINKLKVKNNNSYNNFINSIHIQLNDDIKDYNFIENFNSYLLSQNNNLNIISGNITNLTGLNNTKNILEKTNYAKFSQAFVPEDCISKLLHKSIDFCLISNSDKNTENDNMYINTQEIKEKAFSTQLNLDSNITDVLPELSYNNPVKDKLILKFKTQGEYTPQIRLTSILGHQVYNKKININNNSNKIEISTSTLNKGFYILRISFNNNKTIIKKIIKS